MPLSTSTGDQHMKNSKRSNGQRRLSRNESEKLRRDKLNMHIAELAKLVPLVATAPRKLDKSSVLRLSVNYLRTHYELKNAVRFKLPRPNFLTKHNLEELLLETSDGFLLILSQSGVVLYTTHMISTLLGYCQADVIGTSVYHLIHADDIPLCTEQFQWFQPEPDISPTAQGTCVEGTSLTTAYAMPKNGRRSFYVRMLNLLYKEQKSYELVHMVCHVRNFMLPQRKESSTIIVGVGRLLSQQAIHEVTVQPSNTLEFVTQHSLDGKIIYADQRQALCNGRLPHEVYGTMPYDYIVEADMPGVQFSHQRVMVEGEIGSTVFRAYTKTGGIIYLESRSCIWLDKWTKAPKFIISHNVLISEKIFQALISQQRCLMDAAAVEQSGSESDSEESNIKRPRLDSDIIDIINSPDAAEQSEESDRSQESSLTSAEQIQELGEDNLSLTPNSDRPSDACSPKHIPQLDKTILDDSLFHILTPGRDKSSADLAPHCLIDKSNKVIIDGSKQPSQGSTILFLHKNVPKKSDSTTCIGKDINDENTSNSFDDRTFPDSVNSDTIDVTTFNCECNEHHKYGHLNHNEWSKSNIHDQHFSYIQNSGHNSNIDTQGGDEYSFQRDSRGNQSSGHNGYIYKQISATENGKGCTEKTRLGCGPEHGCGPGHKQTARSDKEPPSSQTGEENNDVRDELANQIDIISSSLVNGESESTQTIQTEDNNWLQELASSAISSLTETLHKEEPICKEGNPSSGERSLRDMPQDNLKRTLIQTHLANQLQTKYQELDGNLKKQESDLSQLKGELLEYLLSHPEAREAYMERIHKLESKRQSHEENLRSLQTMCQTSSMTNKRLSAPHSMRPLSEQTSAMSAVSEDRNIPPAWSMCQSGEEKLSPPPLTQSGDSLTKPTYIPVSVHEDATLSACHYSAKGPGSSTCAHFVPRTDRQSLFAQFLQDNCSLECSLDKPDPERQLMCPTYPLQSKRHHFQNQHNVRLGIGVCGALSPTCSSSSVYDHTTSHIGQNFSHNTDVTDVCSNLPTVSVDAQPNPTQCEETDLISPPAGACRKLQPYPPSAKSPYPVKPSVDTHGSDTSHQSPFDYLHIV